MTPNRRPSRLDDHLANLSGDVLAARTTRRRSGLAAMVALVSISFATVIAAVILKTGVAEHGYMRRLERQLQAGWLVEAGLDRAAAQLVRTPTYSGETWPIAASHLGGSQDAVVHIAINREASNSKRRTVHVTVMLDPKSVTPIEVSKETIFAVGEL
jgi:hypothetical protein